jgi:hypothetical protein
VAFNDSSASWWARGVHSCGDSKAWSCSLVVAGEFFSGFNIHHFFDKVWSCRSRRRSLMVLVDPDEDICVICLVFMVFFKKKDVCCTPDEF